MNTSRDWEKPIRRLELLMRLKSFPVAFKLLEDKEDIAKVPFIRRPNTKMTMCQLITQVRTFDWTVGADVDDFMSANCPSIIGLTDIPGYQKDGTFRSIVWTKNRVDGKKYESSVPRLPVGKYNALVMAPLVYNPFDPDIVLIYANPAQMMLLINSLQFEDYEVMQFFCVGETSCADAIARCYLTGKPAMTIPCYGERRYGHAQDDELVMALPPGLVDKALKGMEALYKRGIRYPISYAGADSDVAHAFPGSYGSARSIHELRGDGKDNRLLLGVTGGIASGKTTVARMLEELGAPIIDFDVLSRIVVEPGRPAWKDIISFFGEQVLLEDKALNRKMLSEIVFRDAEKRKKLESFIHPRLRQEFADRVEEHAKRDPNAVIQAVIPLLIETGMQPIFHNLLMIYVPQEEQISRLMSRDNISREMALNIIKSQLPIDEKRGYCDLAIDNSGPIEETRRSVEKLWEELKRMQRERAQGKPSAGSGRTAGP